MCGNTFAPYGRLKRFCSRVCQLRARNEANQKARRGSRVCRECGDKFIVGYPDKRRDYCSLACSQARNRRIRDAAQDARDRGATIIDLFDPFDVLDREWRCQRCGCDTPRELRGNNADPRAPQVDHVISIRQGGAHTAENAQCLCRACNRDKARSERAAAD
jgi:5-methylcytosine-specific restriction endonuclease McrA